MQQAFIVLPNTERALGVRRAKDYQIHRNLLLETPVCNLETRRDLIFFYTSIKAKVTEVTRIMSGEAESIWRYHKSALIVISGATLGPP